MGSPTDAVQWRADVVLADGAVARVRPIRPDDDERLMAFHAGLSPETIYYRFFSPHPLLTPSDVEHFTNVDYADRMALVAETGRGLLGVARYDRLPGTADAEVALVVDDANQGRGIATVLLEHLAAAARTNGITRFVAETLPDNRRMLRVFHNAGFDVETGFADGVIRVTFSILPTSSALAAVDQRDAQAASHSIGRLLAPRSVAVIGASRRAGTIGHEVFRNLLEGGFAGPVYPVHPTAIHVGSVRAYPSVLDVPGDVDLAVVAVPAAVVPEIVDQCAAKGVHGLVVISAGFAETGPEGAALERDVLARARAGGMRMVGPNCMGVVNTAPFVGLNATFSPRRPVPGRIGFSSQSGALGIAILDEASRRHLGVSTFVSVGNKADVSGNDLLQWWEQDERTDVILLYLESFGNPRRFSRIARRVARRKPIVAVKSGRSTAGSRAASSHTAALATPDAAVEALFVQTGVIRVDTLEQLFDVAQALVDQPLPRGRGVAIVGNAGGPGILAADACEGAGLHVVELAPETQATLRSFLPAAAAVANPVDLVASATAEHYERAIRTVLADDGVDAVIAVFIPPLVTQSADVAAAIARAATDAGDKPVLANFLGMAGVAPQPTTDERSVPRYAFPESAALALARVAAYAEWRRRPEGVVPDFPDIDLAAARDLVDEAMTDSTSGGAWLRAPVAARLLAAFGIPVAPLAEVTGPEEAVAAAEQLGWPVALKSGSPDIVHKTDVGAVQLGIGGPDELRTAWTSMERRLGPSMSGGLVQPMVPSGVETIVGIVQDRSFGPLVLFGTGGTAVELLGDRALRTVPLTDVDAAELVRSTRGAALLTGYRGAPPADVASLEVLLLRAGRLADEVPELAEMDLNPVVVSAAGAVVVDAKVRLAPPPPRADPTVRRLR